MQLPPLSQQLLPSLSFASLTPYLKQKFYIIQPSLNQSQQYITKVTQWIGEIQRTKDTLKIMRDLLRFYQVRIMVYFRKFFKNVHQDLEKLKNSQQDPKQYQKTYDKFISYVKEIAAVYQAIRQKLKVKQIPYFSFFNKYGSAQKDIYFSDDHDIEYQKKYWQFLSQYLGRYEQLKQNKKSDIHQKQIYLKDIKQSFKQLKTKQSDVFQNLTLNHLCSQVKYMVSSSFLCLQQKPPGISTLPCPISSASIPAAQQLIYFQHLCCRQYFQQSQVILQPQSSTIQYKNYRHPYDKYCIDRFRKTITGFLNRAGGVILVGIYQADSKYKEVRGQFITENRKESILKDFRYIIKDIYPDIINAGLLAVKFVPIKNRRQQFIPGKYIVRVQIKQGNPTQMYSFKQQNRHQQYIAIRTQNQVLRRYISQQVLQMYRQKLLFPQVWVRNHPGDCDQPESGIPITYDKYDKNQNAQYVVAESVAKAKYVQRENQDQNKIQADTEKNYGNKDKSYGKNNDKSQGKDKEKSEGKSKGKKNQSKIEKPKNKFNKFSVQSDQDEKQRKRKFNQNVRMAQSTVIKPKQQQIDFISIKPKYGKKKYLPKEEIPQQQNGKKWSYKNPYQQLTSSVSRNAASRTLKQLDLSNSSTIQFLIIGLPFNIVSHLAVLEKLPFKKPPIQCKNTYFTQSYTWLLLDKQSPTIQQNFKSFKTALIKQRANGESYSQILKIRRVYKNLYFNSYVLLSKLIEKFNKEQDFISQGIVYYKCQSSFQAIKGYLQAWDMNQKIKFMDDQEFNKRKRQKKDSD